MSFLDKNGDTLAQSDKVLILGHVDSVSGNQCQVTLTKYGNSTPSLQFQRSEPVHASFSGDHVSGTVTGNPVNANDDVLILGTITVLTTGIHNVANVDVLRNGQTESLTFFCNEMIKAEVIGDQITGVLSGPT